MYIHIEYIIAMVLGFLAGYLLYLFCRHFKISEGRQILYFILPFLPLGILIGLFKSLSGFLFAYIIGFFTCLIVQTSKEAEGGNVDDVQRRLNAVFVKSANDGNLPAVQALLDAGADVNSKSSHFGDIALIVAAEKGHVDVVRLLLKNGLDGNSKGCLLRNILQ